MSTFWEYFRRNCVQTNARFIVRFISIQVAVQYQLTSKGVLPFKTMYSQFSASFYQFYFVHKSTLKALFIKRRYLNQ